jgi:hypothetical protein
MGVVTPDRPVAAPPTPQPQLRRFPTGLVVLVVVLVGGFLLVGWVRDLLPNWGNPFGTETIDRSGPAVLKSVQNLHDFRAASGHFEVIVDVEQDTHLVPDSIKGERILFVAIGSVDAGVEFSGLDARAVEVSDDRRSVVLELPPATLKEPDLDLERSYVYDRDRGAIDRIQSLFGDDAGVQSDLFPLAEEKLAAAARNGSGLVSRAERNTRLMLEGLLRSLGFTAVDIRFAEV